MASGEAEPSISVLNAIGPQTFGTKQATLAFFTILIYDYILTLPEEIEFIWKRKISLVTCLFFINRYYALAVFSIGTAANMSILFTPTICKHFVSFLPFAIGIVMTLTPDIILAIRVYAVYQKSKLIATLLSIYLVAELGVALRIYLAPGSHPLSLPSVVQDSEVFHICIEEEADSLGNIRSAVFQIMQTIYDTCIFLLISFKAFKTSRSSKRVRSVQSLIIAHGIVYYAVLFSANLTWAMMILLAPTGLKYSAASPTLILACTVVNRMTISLRRFGSPENLTGNSESDVPWTIASNTAPSHAQDTTIDTVFASEGESWYGQDHHETYELSLR